MKISILKKAYIILLFTIVMTSCNSPMTHYETIDVQAPFPMDSVKVFIYPKKISLLLITGQ